jgi:hypothetical protein
MPGRILARGNRFFREGCNEIMLSLTDAKTTSTGVAMLTDEPARNGTARSAANQNK